MHANLMIHSMAPAALAMFEVEWDEVVRGILIALLVLIAAGIVLTLIWGLLKLLYFLFSLPLRRRERAGLVLDLVEDGLRRGQSPEAVFASLASGAGRDRSLGKKVRLLAQMCAEGLTFREALTRVPGLLPEQVTRMLSAPSAKVPLAGVIPLCRAQLEDQVSKVWSGQNFVVAILLGAGWPCMVVMMFLMVFVVPKLRQIFDDMAGDSSISGSILGNTFGTAMAIQLTIAIVLLIAGALYIFGPRLMRVAQARVPRVVDRWFPLFPWSRIRQKRDFTAFLGLLLDSGVPEAEALELAAQAAGSGALPRNARLAALQIKSGVGILESLRRMDGSGEFAWRMGNALRGKGGFAQALGGWTEALDAKAFFVEQTWSQSITTLSVIIQGTAIGIFLYGTFSFFTRLIMACVLW